MVSPSLLIYLYYTLSFGKYKDNIPKGERLSLTNFIKEWSV